MQVDQLEAMILKALPVSVDELLLKLEFMRRQVLQIAGSDGGVTGWLGTLERDVLSPTQSQLLSAKVDRRV